MASNDYHFVTRWRVEGTCGEIADILRDPTRLPAWWPAVYLAVRPIGPARAPDLGPRVALVTRGWLPYTITWELETVESRYPFGSTIVATGDFDGHGVWTFEQDGPSVNITYDWRVRADKPLLRRLSFLMRPLFAANHRWAMAQGEASLRLELQRRRAASDAARAAVPDPPGPVTYTPFTVAAAVAAVGAGLAFLVRRARRRSLRDL
jgi:hypothetical protein